MMASSCLSNQWPIILDKDFPVKHNLEWPIMQINDLNQTKYPNEGGGKQRRWKILTVEFFAVPL
jgi:hypothetical protein